MAVLYSHCFSQLSVRALPFRQSLLHFHTPFTSHFITLRANKKRNNFSFCSLQIDVNAKIISDDDDGFQHEANEERNRQRKRQKRTVHNHSDVNTERWCSLKMQRKVSLT